MNKIHWSYQYIEGGKLIFDNDEINIKPDKHGRWAIRGFVYIKTNAMPGYVFAGEKVAVPIAWVENSDDYNKFISNFAHIKDANIGYGQSYFYGETPREVMNKIEESFEYTINCFKNIE
jgi:hypothetical protein